MMEIFAMRLETRRGGKQATAVPTGEGLALLSMDEDMMLETFGSGEETIALFAIAVLRQVLVILERLRLIKC